MGCEYECSVCGKGVHGCTCGQEQAKAETDSNRYEDAAKFLDASEKEKAEMIKKLAKELSGEGNANGG